MKGYLVLEDGSFFAGVGFGAACGAAGEVVFHTGMTGYQEILTDPSSCGQIVLMTYPLIGNYGINPVEFESQAPQIRGFVVKELCERPSHWQSEKSLSAFLAEHGIPGVAGIDTRKLTRHLRGTGTLRGFIVAPESEAPPTPEQVDAWVAEAQGFALHDQVKQVTTAEPYRLAGTGHRVVVVDYGGRAYILRALQERSCDITVVPATATAQEILALGPDGVLLTGGPGNPADLPEAIETVRQLTQVADLPLFGIGLGLQLLCLALGAETYKLKHGHRGSNHPVKDLTTNRIYITSQNHGYAVAEASLKPDEVAVTHRNLNDGTVEGVAHRQKPFFGVQFHPEVTPGARENEYFFERFVSLMDRFHPVKLLA